MKVYLTGGDGNGWALDEDLYFTKEALSRLEGVALVDSLRDAEIVHSVWSNKLMEYSEESLAGKKIVCHMNASTIATLKETRWLELSRRVGRWVVQSYQDEDIFRQMGMSACRVAYCVRDDIFMPLPGRKSEIRADLGFAEKDYVIGNFMRDSLGANLRQTKPEKCPELFFSIVRDLHRRGNPVKVLLGGPRRHWIRSALKEAGVPFVFIGDIRGGEDYPLNILSRNKLNDLYSAMNVLLVTSRSEGGPMSVIEAVASECPVASTPVGLAPDILESDSVFRSFAEGVTLLERDIRTGSLEKTINVQKKRLKKICAFSASVEEFRHLYKSLAEIPIFSVPQKSVFSAIPQEGFLGKAARRVKKKLIKSGWLRPFRGKTICLWHEFHKPPYGGGNQFMLALQGELERRGCRVVDGARDGAYMHVCNSAWFDRRYFEKLAERGKVAMVHRIDGPISLIRGCGPEKDDEIFELNRQFASVTILQSWFTFRELKKLGYNPRNPMIISNACNPNIFHPEGQSIPQKGEKIRIIASSWSDNPKKGGATLKWLEENLDWSRYELTFVGRTKVKFDKARHVSAQDSGRLANLIRSHHIYITASERDPCSNALIEAMSCGLPAIALDDGGHPELVGFGGRLFREKKEIPGCLEDVSEHWEDYRRLIKVPTIGEIADLYLRAGEFAHRGFFRPKLADEEGSGGPLAVTLQ